MQEKYGGSAVDWRPPAGLQVAGDRAPWQADGPDYTAAKMASVVRRYSHGDPPVANRAVGVMLNNCVF